MRIMIGAGILMGALAMGFAVLPAPAAASSNAGMQAVQLPGATDISARRRIHRSHRHYHYRPRVYIRGPYQPYYGRPAYYVPQGPAPFFPFGFGYGLDPSW
jgi:hypothetical protein